MKIGSAFPSKYLKAADLQGKEVKKKIAKVTMENVGGQGAEEDKPILYLVGSGKGIVLNRTNAMTLAAKYGDDTDGWTNQEVVVYPDQTLYQGRMVDCIRVRIPAAPVSDHEEPPF